MRSCVYRIAILSSFLSCSTIEWSVQAGQNDGLWYGLAGSQVQRVQPGYDAVFAYKGTNYLDSFDFRLEGNRVLTNDVSDASIAIRRLIDTDTVNDDLYWLADMGRPFFQCQVLRWRGREWEWMHPMLGGVTLGLGPEKIAILDDLIIVGGYPAIGLGLVNDTPTLVAKKWDSDNWEYLGGSMPVFRLSNDLTSVHVIERFGSGVLIAGSFDSMAEATYPDTVVRETARSVVAKNIAYWDGTQWHGIGDGLDGKVRSMVLNGTNIIVAVDQPPHGRVAQWNGRSWELLGDSMDSLVMDLAVHEGRLFATGFFKHVGSRVANGIAYLQNGEWQTIGVGLSSTSRSEGIGYGRGFVRFGANLGVFGLFDGIDSLGVGVDGTSGFNWAFWRSGREDAFTVQRRAGGIDLAVTPDMFPYIVESSAGVETGTWTVVPGTSDARTVRIETTRPKEFYRLRPR